ncbi:hypothetical protein ACRXCV_00290 (plasmid) [Halobacteriovorax sp. GFR7]|uniref:hypothetical protein n=1 Tax=unclassified Halobacteriovorax TaxID=2639665 RepID=UPI003D981F9A
MLARTTAIKATYKETVHVSTWAVYRMALIKVGGMESAAAANAALQTTGVFYFQDLKIEVVKSNKSRGNLTKYN